MSQGNQGSVLERWAAKADRPVTLPTGQRAKVRVPDIVDLIRDKGMPQGLREMALRFDVSVMNTTTMQPEELMQLVELRGMLVTRTLRALWDDEAPADAQGDHWVAINLDPADYPSLALPGDDLQALENIALRRETPNQVTARSERDQGLLSAAEAAQVQREEAGGTVDGWAGFRGEPGGPGPGPDSTDVRPPAERPGGGAGPSAGPVAG